MSANRMRLARSLAGAGAGLALLGVALDPAIAASLGGSCCADLEERVAELEATTARKGNRKVDLKISGAVSRALLFWDDGEEQNTYSVDNAKDATTFIFDGEAEIASGWKAGFTLGVDAVFAGSDLVDQFNDSGNGGFLDLADSFVFLSNERLGTVRLGQTDSASDKIDNINLSGADVVADNAVQDHMASFFLRSGKQVLLDARWEEFVTPVAGTNANLVAYVSPTMMGFQASAAVGQDDFQDVALRYGGEWFDVLEVQAGVGFYRNTTEGNTTDPVTGRPLVNDPVDDEGWGGSIALKHKPTGLNIAVNYSTLSHNDRCFNPGLVSLGCRGDDELLYVIGGIVRDIIPLGATHFYGEYYQGTRELNDSDPAKVGTPLPLASAGLALTAPAFDEDRELEESNLTVWGFGVVQKIEDSKTADKKGSGAAKGAAVDPVMEVFLGYKHYELDVDLIGRTGTGPVVDVAAKKLNDFDAVVTGAIIRF
jgi:hypothetical protein